MLLLAVIISGCGASTYEERLKESKDYFAFIQRYNDQLEKPWKDGVSGIELRVPKKLKPIPAVTTPAAEGEEAPKDPRQPDYVELELPGLVGAWSVPVGTMVDGSPTAVNSYLYVLCNAVLLKSPNPPFPANEFHDEVVERLSNALGVPVPKPDVWIDESFPRTATYVKPKPFHSLLLTPTEPVNGVPTEFKLYEYQSGDMRVSILAVMPQGATAKDNFLPILPLSLETLSVPPQPPATAVPATPGAGPSGAAKKSGGF
ncbi:MAG: hypothetical protein AB7O26_17945 [Planctomycetaceae bacterium]